VKKRLWRFREQLRTTFGEKAAMRIFASSGHKFGQLTIHRAYMASSKSPIRSRQRCPNCGSPLFYVNTLFTFLTR